MARDFESSNSKAPDAAQAAKEAVVRIAPEIARRTEIAEQSLITEKTRIEAVAKEAEAIAAAAREKENTKTTEKPVLPASKVRSESKPESIKEQKTLEPPYIVLAKSIYVYSGENGQAFRSENGQF